MEVAGTSLKGSEVKRSRAELPEAKSEGKKGRGKCKWNGKRKGSHFCVSPQCNCGFASFTNIRFYQFRKKLMCFIVCISISKKSLK